MGMEDIIKNMTTYGIFGMLFLYQWKSSLDESKLNRERQIEDSKEFKKESKEREERLLNIISDFKIALQDFSTSMQSIRGEVSDLGEEVKEVKEEIKELKDK